MWKHIQENCIFMNVRSSESLRAKAYELYWQSQTLTALNLDNHGLMTPVL